MTFIYVLLSYFIGSIPSGYIAGKVLKNIDIRTVGDGNIGAANVSREIGTTAGMIVLAADIAKGILAMLIAKTYASQDIMLLCGLAVIAGHNWPIYIRFRGGRGEATTIGVLLVLLPKPMLILMGIALIPFLITRNTMLVAVILFAPLWLLALLMGAPPIVIIYSILLPCLVGLRHLWTTRHLPTEVKKRCTSMKYQKKD